MSEQNNEVAFYRTNQKNIYLAGEDRVILPDKNQRLDVQTKGYSGGFIPIGFVVVKTPINSSEQFITLTERIDETRLIDGKIYNQLFSEFSEKISDYQRKLKGIEDTYKGEFSKVTQAYLNEIGKIEEVVTRGRNELGVAPRIEDWFSKVIFRSDLGRRII